MRIKTIFLISVMALMLGLSACTTSTDSPDSIRTLSISGTGTEQVDPDIAYIYIGVHTEDADIGQAVSDNNEQAQAVEDALRNLSVADADIQTSNFSVWSSQQYDKDTGDATGYIYSVDNTVYVTVRDLSKLPELLDTAIQAGANNINSISFDVADKTAPLSEARQKAMENAIALAEEIAESAEVSLGQIQTISYSDYGTTSYYGYGVGGGGGGGGGSAAAPINPGQLQLSVSVNIVYEIR